jgi:CheY-like chemotaxis protein
MIPLPHPQPGYGTGHTIDHLPQADKNVMTHETDQWKNRPHSAEYEKHPRPPQIVVIDDQIELIRALHNLLKMRGHNVHSFADGMSALEYISHHPVALVLSDYHMPQLDGIALARQLQAKRWPGIFLLMSGDQIPLTFTEQKQLRIAKVIHKPFNLVHILALIRSVLPH